MLYLNNGKKLGNFGLQFQASASGNKLDLLHKEFRALLRLAPLVLFRGFAPLSRKELLSLSAEDPDSDLLHWSFGPVMELSPDEEAKNYLFSREAVPFHWDGAFYRVPSYLVFHCLRAPAEAAGGETIFANTEAIYADATEAERECWSRVSLRYETETVAHYGGSITVPMVDEHPQSRRKIIRFAEAVETKLNPVHLTVYGAARQEDLIHDLTGRLYDPRYLYEHQWQEGDLLVADNHSLLHGRRALLEASTRHLRRVQIL